ncbi:MULTISPECIES: Mu transposase C-terminal domain-containing protein [unclassified Microbacterium]|uniref:Mu transposase C-terminal domain-containing protein n=1 Tax=unclassified Microbacterium TaxID=2609290 RepID=UPI00109D3FDD|nr:MULTISPECIES: Mu transposase C-terminal domain-containing protein [unclassified Microbacterium]NIG66748.1 DDE-type integrase/transposase/recombinase [Microbacterium sp. Be9]
MRVVVGGSLVWRQRRFAVLFIENDSAMLRDEDGSEVEVALDELGHDATPVPSDTSGLLNLSLQVQDIEPDMDPWLQSCIRIEATREEIGVGKAVETEREWLETRLSKTVSTRAVERRLKAFREQGTTTAGKCSPRKSTWDPRLVEAINHVLGGKSRASTVSRTTAIEQITRRVERLHGDAVKLPSRATFFRLLEADEHGQFTFGSAKTRESLALQPDGKFGTRTALRPGELVEMDSTRIDVMLRIDEETVGRPELTILLDVATRSILAAMLRPEGTKSVDLVAVLARALVPYGRRMEGVRETRQLISTAWADDQLIDQERFERLRLAQPYVFPDTITTDRGRNYLSRHFRAACETLNISLITSAPHTPTDKPHVERAFGAINSMLLQHVKGYVGRSVEHRGRDTDVESDELLTIAQAQELLEDWIAVEWQSRPHDGLRDPLHPRIKLSPNEMCRAFRAYVPELHVPLTRDDYTALLPVQYRVLNRYGVRIDHRIYNSERLKGLWRRKSDDKARNGRWPIRVDPYNLHVVWLEHDGEFIPLRWSNQVHELPMLGDVWRYARAEHALRDVELDTERRELTIAIKAFAGQGNRGAKDVKPARNARQRARVAAIADDPMNFTSLKSIELEETPADEGELLTDGTSVDEWPNTGGFPFIGDALDEARRRIDE